MIKDSKTNSPGFKSVLVKALGKNPINGILFRLFKRRISFNHITIRVISFLLRQRIPFHDTVINVSDRSITPMVKSLLYYQVYEDKEVAFAMKYIDPEDDVIELGSSIGVMGCIISRRQTTGKYISVEADPSLMKINRKNIEFNRKTDFVLINKAVDYSSKTVSFSTSKSNLTGKVQADGSGDSTIAVETTTLIELCSTYNLKDFVLVSDIEGAEVTILLNDKSSLDSCSKMIIELHDTEYNNKTYMVPDIVNLITNCGFNVTDQERNVYVFTKPERNS